MTPDEVRMMDNNYALLFIRGERPIMDRKYDLLKHPNVVFTTDGKGNPYTHGGTENAVAAITFLDVSPANLPEPEAPETEFELLPEKDAEALFDFI